MLVKNEVFKFFIVLSISSQLHDFQQHASMRGRVFCRERMADSAAQTGIDRHIQ